MFAAGSGILGLAQSGVAVQNQSIIGQYLTEDNGIWSKFVFSFALNGSDSSATSVGSYGGVMHVNGADSSFYAGNLVTMQVASSSQQSSFGSVPSQLGSYDWTVEMQGWTMDSVVNGQKQTVSGGVGGIYSTFESAYPYILLPLADAEKICESIASYLVEGIS